MTAQTGRRVAISAGSLAVLLGALDTYVVVTIMRDIMHDVGIPVNQLQRITWIVTMYLLGYIAAMPLLGRAPDRFGRKLLLQAALALFIVGSVVTALAGQFGDFHMLIGGRTIQGVASGALLPVTLALGADLWSQRNRAAVLGGIGAAQELGSVLGPLYGIFIVFVFHDWRYVFWINVPLTLIAMVMIQFSLPSRDRTEAPERIDLVGGLLLAIALGLAVIGLYNPSPDGKQVLPSYGLPLVIGALIAAVAFVVWERFSRTRLIEPAGVRFRPFLAALLVAGVGLGLVVGPLSSAALRVVPAAQHGIASAAVVVARMTGMLIGISALTAWGFYRFNQIVAGLTAAIPPDASLLERVVAQGSMYIKAFAAMYGDIFKVTV